ncbi:hypothetical protein J6590_033732 [Homalodisca vitripennis]|nr:hypothetical protein J6590_033732 [Homalodisca vitripennis]
MILMMRGSGDWVRSYDEVRYLLNGAYPNRTPVSKSGVQKQCNRLEEVSRVPNPSETKLSVSSLLTRTVNAGLSILKL